ncbi:hypothetical protein THAOC_29904, partial [Thalassiosira oceanica]
LFLSLTSGGGGAARMASKIVKAPPACLPASSSCKPIHTTWSLWTEQCEQLRAARRARSGGITSIASPECMTSPRHLGQARHPATSEHERVRPNSSWMAEVAQTTYRTG